MTLIQLFTLKENVMKTDLKSEDLLAVVASTTNLGIADTQRVLHLSQGRILPHTCVTQYNVQMCICEFCT